MTHIYISEGREDSSMQLLQICKISEAKRRSHFILLPRIHGALDIKDYKLVALCIAFKDSSWTIRCLEPKLRIESLLVRKKYAHKIRFHKRNWQPCIVHIIIHFLWSYMHLAISKKDVMKKNKVKFFGKQIKNVNKLRYMLNFALNNGGVARLHSVEFALSASIIPRELILVCDKMRLGRLQTILIGFCHQFFFL